MSNGGALRGALALVGYGKIPVPLVIVELCLCWGASGMIVNRIVSETLGTSPALVAIPSIVVATAAALGGAMLLARILVRFWPTNQNFGVDVQDLRGSIAVVTHPVSDHYGTVSLRDRFDTQHTLYCRGRAGQPTLPSGTQVLLIEFDETRRMFIVEPITDQDLQ
jgi:hypothetical protein